MAQRSTFAVLQHEKGATKADDVLSDMAAALITTLSRTFFATRQQLIDARGKRPLGFLPETRTVRESVWQVAEIPKDLRERQVEITGPPDKKMVINALRSGASVFMADFEDACSPTWDNLIEGQRTLARAVRRDLQFTDAATGKHYAVPQKDEPCAVLMARPRGLHLDEAHLTVDGHRVPAAFFDAALYVLHNAHELLARGSGPYLYLPKLESHLEARLWNDALRMIEDACALGRGTVKVTVLIETLPAAFEMDEILFELKERCVGLNCGRWDYLFSTIKRRRGEAGYLTPDRAQLTMDQPAMRAYSELLIQTCHRRGAFAMGGMSAFIPRKDDAEKNAQAFAKVRADKEREAKAGHDGTWVAHPGLVAVAREVFAAQLKGKPNQLDVMRSDVMVSREDLLRAPVGTRTDEGLRQNVRVGIHYLAAWLGGQGCVPIEGLMEDAATAEISRTQLWQWLHTGAEVGNSRLTRERLRLVADEETAHVDLPTTARAKELFLMLIEKSELEEFLTVPAYEWLS